MSIGKPSITLSRAKLASMIDSTQVRAYATQLDITELCDEAVACGFAAVSINSAWTVYCAKRLQGSSVRVNPAIGFPLGATTAHIKVEETREAVRNGAQEIDMVINIGALRSGFPGFVEREIAAVVAAAGDKPLKVILETSFLTRDEKIAVCEMSVRAGAAFVQTSTGYGFSGAKEEDVRLMREVVGNTAGVKAAGGIRTYGDAVALLAAGATRIGTSVGAEILEDAPEG